MLILLCNRRNSLKFSSNSDLMWSCILPNRSLLPTPWKILKQLIWHIQTTALQPKMCYLLWWNSTISVIWYISVRWVFMAMERSKDVISPRDIAWPSSTAPIARNAIAKLSKLCTPIIQVASITWQNALIMLLYSISRNFSDLKSQSFIRELSGASQLQKPTCTKISSTESMLILILVQFWTDFAHKSLSATLSPSMEPANKPEHSSI